ncbi:hypothetical protein BH23ACT11_BH23ACT11_09840 [soil metagenome]
MARERAGKVGLPFSGDVTQPINSWTWWVTSMRQFGFININQMESGDDDLELEIIENVASYGKQLGRTVDALAVLASQIDTSDLDEKSKTALQNFHQMTRNISAAKGDRPGSIDDDLDRLLSGISALMGRDPAAYEAARDRLRQELFEEG